MREREDQIRTALCEVWSSGYQFGQRMEKFNAAPEDQAPERAAHRPGEPFKWPDSPLRATLDYAVRQEKASGSYFVILVSQQGLSRIHAEQSAAGGWDSLPRFYMASIGGDPSFFGRWGLGKDEVKVYVDESIAPAWFRLQYRQK